MNLWSERMARILDGAAIAAAIKQEVAEEVRALAGQGIRPGLAAVLVGHVAASEIYVRSKVQACAELGIYSDLITPPATVTTEEMLDLVATLNGRDDIDGILIQLPLPAHVDAKALLDAVDPGKGCGRISSRECGPIAGGPAGARALHAGGRDRDFAAQRNSHRRPARRGRGPQRHRGQAGGHAAAASERDCDDLPFEDARPRRVDAAGGHSGGGHRARGIHHAGDGEAGRDADRRWDQPHRRRARSSTAFSAATRNAKRPLPSADRRLSATSIRRHSSWPAPTRRCPAAWAC